MFWFCVLDLGEFRCCWTRGLEESICAVRVVNCVIQIKLPRPRLVLRFLQIIEVKANDIISQTAIMNNRCHGGGQEGLVTATKPDSWDVGDSLFLSTLVSVHNKQKHGGTGSAALAFIHWQQIFMKSVCVTIKIFWLRSAACKLYLAFN